MEPEKVPFFIISRKSPLYGEVVNKGGDFIMFVAIKNITEYGQPVYCVNPVETTVDLRQAFKWRTKQEAEYVLHESMHVYGLQAYAVEIIESQAAAKVVTQNKQELKAV
jgi:hypothetical protein